MPRLWRKSKPKDSVESTAALADPQPPQESPPASQPPSSATHHLWGQEFGVVQNGLAEDQVVEYVERLTADYRTRLQELEDTVSWDTFSRRVLAEAEQEAVRIKARATQEAEVEAARLVSEAKRQSRELVDNASTQADEMTEKSVQDILTTAQRKAQLTESRARQLSQLMLIRAREEAQGAVTEEVHGTYHKLLSSLEDMLSAARAIESDWKFKTVELWGGASLALEGEEPVGLLQTPQPMELSPETPVVTQEPEPATPVVAEQAAAPTTEAVAPAPVQESAEVGPSAQPDDLLEASSPTSESPLEAVSTAAPQEQPEVEASPEARDTPSNSAEEPPTASEEPVFTPSTPASPLQDDDMEETPGRPSAWVGQPSQESREPTEPLLESQEDTDQWRSTISSPAATLPAEGDLDDGDRGAVAFLEQGAPAPAEAASDLEEAIAPKSEEDSAVTEDVTKIASLAQDWQQAREEGSSEDGGQHQDWYAGEVELVLSPPVDFAQVSKLYGHLQNLPEVRVLHTAGSWDEGTVVTVSLDRPGPLLSQLAAIPFLNVTREATQESGGFLKSAIGTLGERSKRRQRIAISFIDAPEDANVAEEPVVYETPEESEEE